MGKKFEQIDSLRFLAVLAVMCGHYIHIRSPVLSSIISASRGVDLFFVISGFLITLGLIRSREKAQSTGTSFYKFYARRFLRIFPAYYLFLFCLWAFMPAKVAGAIWWYIFYASNFYSIRIQDWGGVGHLWSLSVEEQFYLVWPILMLLLPVRSLPVVMILSVLASLAAKSYWYLTGTPFWISYMSTLSCMDTLALGALLAYSYHFYPEKLRVWLYNPIVIAAILIQVIICHYLFYVPKYDVIFHIGVRTSFGLLAAWLIGRAVYGFKGWTGRILTFGPFLYLGTISYGLYLVHPIVPDMCHFSVKDEYLQALIYASISVAIASASWYLFESQILKLKSRFE